MSPMSWNNGSQLTPPSDESSARPRAMAYAFATTARCEMIAPFGAPVVPEVYWRKAVAALLADGSRTGARR